MGQVNLRLNSLLVTFSLSLLSSVCLGFYGMSQSGLQASQAAEIRQEKKLAKQLQREIEMMDLKPEWSGAYAVTELPIQLYESESEVGVQWSTNSILTPECTPAPHFEELLERQKRELSSRLGVFGQVPDSHLTIHR